MVSSAQPAQSFGMSRRGRPNKRTSSFAVQRGLCRMRTCMKRGSPRLKRMGFDRSMTFTERAPSHDRIRECTDVLDPDLDAVARFEYMPRLDAAAVRQCAGAEQLAGTKLLGARGVRQHLAERPL